jgi:hypothetical protein
MRVSLNTNIPTISYKSKISTKKPEVKIPNDFKVKDLSWQTLKQNAKKNLPITLMTVGLLVPIPFASVAGLVIGTAIVKIQKMIKK